MEEKLNKLYDECINELLSINIDVLNNHEIGKIDIKLSPRNVKRYGCCKSVNPDKKYYSIVKKGRTKHKRYEKFLDHHIEISKWVMELDDKIIKNTIMHEIIHCFPYCNNHGPQFKKYAKYINEKLGYNISRVGDRESDYKQSNLKYEVKIKEYKYKLQCQKCGAIIYRQRFPINKINSYRCGKCKGKIKILD